MDLTDKQEWLVGQLPASIDELAESAAVGESALKDRIRRIREESEDPEIIEYVPRANEYIWNGDDQHKQVMSSEHLGQKTRKANRWLSRKGDEWRHEVNKWGLPTCEADPNPSNEDVVLAMSDLHFGDVVEDLWDNEIHSTDILEDLVDYIFDSALSLIERQRRSGVEFDTLHILLDGDLITNENIYPGQFEDLDAYLNEQLDRADETLLGNILKCLDHFDRVNVVCQVGNHGQDRASATTRQANADLTLFHRMASEVQHRKEEIRDLDVDVPEVNERLKRLESLNFRFNNAKFATPFYLRGGEWRGLLCHGQSQYEQISGTSAADDSIKSLVAIDEQTRCDIAYLGHYHEQRDATPAGIPVIRTPSPKPTDDWAKTKTASVRAPDTPKRLAYLHGVSDEYVRTFEYKIKTERDMEFDTPQSASAD